MRKIGSRSQYPLPGPHTHTHIRNMSWRAIRNANLGKVSFFSYDSFSLARSLSLSHTRSFGGGAEFSSETRSERESESAYLDCVFVCGLWPPGRLSTSGQAKARLSQNESVWSVGFSFGEPAPVRSLLDGNSDGRSGVTNRHLSVFLCACVCVCEEGCGCVAEEWVWMWCGPSHPQGSAVYGNNR